VDKQTKLVIYDHDKVKDEQKRMVGSRFSVQIIVFFSTEVAQTTPFKESAFQA